MRLALLVLGGLAIAYAAIAVFERLAPRRVVRGYQKFVGNPLQRPSTGIMPGWAVIETVGRRTGRPRQVPVGGRECESTAVGEAARRIYSPETTLDDVSCG